MDTFDLNIKQAVRVNRDAGRAQNISSQTRFVAPLDAPELRLKASVALNRSEALELIEIEPPGIAQRVVQQMCQARVGLRQPAARRNAIGHVGEPPRPDTGEI